jgi:CheY-like chemotaxis protein
LFTVGAEGLERVGSEPPDVIFLDPGLPDQSGLLPCRPRQ